MPIPTPTPKAILSDKANPEPLPSPLGALAGAELGVWFFVNSLEVVDFVIDAKDVP
jgi:hypothetical protein